MEGREHTRYPLSRGPSNKTPVPSKGCQNFIPRSAGSVSRPHRSEHVSELIEFFRKYDLPLHHSDIGMGSWDSPPSPPPKKAERFQTSYKGEEDVYNYKKRTTPRIFTPDIWNRSGSKERHKPEKIEKHDTENLDPRSLSNTPSGFREQITTPTPGIEKEVRGGEGGGECVYPGVGVLPSIPNTFSGSRKGSDVSSYVESHDLSSVTLTGDVSIDDTLNWTETSTDRGISSEFEAESILPRINRSDNGKEDVNCDSGKNLTTAVQKENAGEFNINIWQEHQLQTSVGVDSVASDQIQLNRHDATRAMRPRSAGSVVSKRRSIATIRRESTYIDIQYLPRRISSKKERRAGRAEFTNLCCDLSYPGPEDGIFEYLEDSEDLKREKPDGKPVPWNMVAGEGASLQPQGGFSTSIVEGPSEFRSDPSTSNRSSENSSNYGFAFSPMSNNSPITDAASPLTWNDFPEYIKERRAYTPNTPVEMTPWVMSGEKNETASLPDRRLTQGTNSCTRRQASEDNTNVLPKNIYRSPQETKRRDGFGHSLPLREIKSKVTDNGGGARDSKNVPFSTKFNLPLRTAGFKHNENSAGIERGGDIGTVLETPQESSPQFWNPSIDELCGQSSIADSTKTDSITTQSVFAPPMLDTPPISPRGTVMEAHSAPKIKPSSPVREQIATPFSSNTPRHSRSFPTPSQPKKASMLSPRSAAGLSASGDSSRAISPSLPSSDEEGLGTRASYGKSHRSTRSDRSRSRRNSPTTADNYNQGKRQFPPGIPERESSARHRRQPSRRDSSLSPSYSAASFSRRPSTSGSFGTVQQQHLQDRVFFLERQNKMLQAALISALDVGSTYDADMIRSGFAIAPKAGIANAGDDIGDLLSFYRQSCASTNTAGNGGFRLSYYNGAAPAGATQLDMDFGSTGRSQSASGLDNMRSRILSDSDVASLDSRLGQMP